jgi:hypothetical protein
MKREGETPSNPRIPNRGLTGDGQDEIWRSMIIIIGLSIPFRQFHVIGSTSILPHAIFIA